MRLETVTANQRFYEFGAFRLDAEERLLWCGSDLVPLPPKALDLLCALIIHNGQLLTKERLLDLVWPDTFVEEGNLAYTMSLLRRALGDAGEQQRFIETLPRRGYRFLAPVVSSSLREPPPSFAPQLETRFPLDELEPVGGAVSLDSPFYITRLTDQEFGAAIARRDSIVLLKGARQVGKSSLLARGLQQARHADAKVVLTDFQMLGARDLTGSEQLFLTLAELIARRLGLTTLPHAVWDPLYSPNLNFEDYLLRHVLKELDGPLVWGCDEVDRLFAHDYASEVFGLFRSWHNARALDPDGPWRNLTLALAYATEAHLFITDLNQSPFNVGTRLRLDDFTLAQVAELNRRYGGPLRTEADLARFYELVGGNPYLVRRGLHELVNRQLELTQLEVVAVADEGPFGDHLRRLLTSLSRDASLCAAVRALLQSSTQGQGTPDVEQFYRLRSAGVVRGEAARDAQLRCRLYANYLGEHLL